MPSRGYTHPGKRTASYYDPTLSTVYPNSLWTDCPLLEYAHDPMIGTYLNESWQSYNPTATTGDYVLTQAVSGTAAISTAYPGSIALDAGAATVTQGVNLQRLKSAWLPATGKDLWFEATVRMTTTVVSQLFIGLSESRTAIIATSALASQNCLGFSCVTNNGVLLFGGVKATVATTQAAVTVSTSAWNRIGFKYDGTADTVTPYINGVAGTAVATTYIPKVVVYPSFVCQAGGTGQPVMNVGAVRIFQLR